MTEVCSKCGGREIVRNYAGDGGAMDCECRVEKELKLYLKHYHSKPGGGEYITLKDSPLLKLDMDDFQLVDVSASAMKMGPWYPHFKTALTHEFYRAKRLGIRPRIWNGVDANSFLDVKYGTDIGLKYKTFAVPDLLIIWAPTFPQIINFYNEFHGIIGLRNSKGKGTWVVGSNLRPSTQPGDSGLPKEVSTEFRILWDSCFEKGVDTKTRLTRLTVADTRALQDKKDTVLTTKGVGAGGYDITSMKIDPRINRVSKEMTSVANDDNGSDGKSKGK